MAALLMLLSLNNAMAQRSAKWCFTDEYHRELLKTNAEYRQSREELEITTRNFLQAKNALPAQKLTGAPIYTITVVFHIIHQYGYENIPKSRVLDEMEFLNKSFQNLWADTTDVNPPFKSIISDCQIEFKLAQIDPNGNCTDGITRTVSPYTYGQDNLVKGLINWPSDKYMNVWVVASIAGNSGTLAYATYPANNNPNDGIVTMSTYVGNPVPGYNQRVLTHEVGHWLNLAHTWGSSNGPGLPQNCSDDDFVQDTPNCIGTFACDYTQVTCNTLDNVENYMDYASCSLMFTEGQKTRVHAALNSSIGSRNNLHTLQNLTATGTSPGFSAPACLPVVDFSFETHYICTGSTVNFADLSWRGDPASWQWDFPGGTPSSSNDQNPVIQYNTPGIYDVTLTVSNGGGSNSLTKTANVVVAEAIGSTVIPFLEDFENTGPIPSGADWIIENPAGNGWELSTVAAFSGTKSMRLLNHSGNANGTVDAFITPAYNLTNITNASMTFRVAFAARSTSSTDNLKVFATNNCGQQWNMRYTKSGLLLSTGGIVTGSFTPNSSQWREDVVSINTVAYNEKPSVKFKFEYTQNTGNNIYIDNINISGTSTVGIQDVQFLATLAVYPNPTNAGAQASFSLSEPTLMTIQVTDIAGRVLSVLENSKMTPGNYMYRFGGDYKAGIYFIRFVSGENDLTQKIIFTR